MQLASSKTSNETLVTLLKNAATDETHGITFIDGADKSFTLSYSELYKNALNVLGHLQSIGVNPGDEVIIQQEDNHDFLLTFWACILGGIIPVPLSIGNTENNRLKLIGIWKILKNPYLYIDSRNLDILKNGTDKLQSLKNDELISQILSRTYSFSKTNSGYQTAADYTAAAEDIAYIQFSSGSTGAPKGVVLTHENLVVNAMDIAGRSSLNTEDATLSWMPLTHDMGMICFHLSSLYARVRQYIMPTSLFVRRPQLWIDKVSEHRVTHLYSPNFGLHYFLSAFRSNPEASWDLSAVKLIYNGAEPISATLCEQFVQVLKPFGLNRNAMYPGYGLAEASVAVTLPRPGASLKTYELHRSTLSLGSEVKEALIADTRHTISFVGVGYPVDHCKVRICNNDEAILPENHIGHIQIKGKNVTTGYYNDPEASVKAFTSDGWLRTGDLGFMTNGELIVTGRFKDIIIINGQNYYPHDIEILAEDIEGLGPGKVAACGIPDPAGNQEELVLFVYFKKPLKSFIPLIFEIKQRLRSGIGLEVRHVLRTAKIPKTTSGKIQRFKLAEQYGQGFFDEELAHQELAGYDNSPLATSSKALEKVSLNVCQVLNNQLDPDDNLFEAGLNSLQAMRLAASLQQQLEVKLEVGEIFDNPTINQLIAYAEKNRTKHVSRVHALSPRSYYDLLPAQQRIWLLNEFNNQQSAFNISVAYIVAGPLKLDVFTESLRLLHNRHESLRTCFIEIEGKPKQKIRSDAEMPFELAFHNLSPFAENADLVDACVKTQAKLPFNLSEGPLWRATLIKTSEHEYVFCLCIHHIIADGWSVGLIFQEVSQLYSALSENSDDVLPGLPIQYKDCVAHKINELDADAIEKDRAYWVKEFDGELPSLNLPFFQTPPTLPLFKGKQIRFFIPSAETHTLRQLAINNGATLYMTLITLVNVLFYKYTGDKDIIIGTNTAGRTNADYHKQIGYFLNTIALRFFIDPDKTFKQLLAVIKAKILTGFEHQRYPFEWLITDLGLSGNISRPPLFNVLVLYQNFDFADEINEGQLEFGKDFQTKRSHFQQEGSLVDLQFDFINLGEQIACDLTFNSDLFHFPQMVKLGQYLTNIVRQICDSPDDSVQNLALLDAENQKKILSWSRSSNAENMFSSAVGTFIENQCATMPSRTAVVFEGLVLTYQQLNDKANRLAHYLLNNFLLTSGDKVAISMGRSEKLIVSLLAILKTGAAYVSIDKDYPEARKAFIIEDSSPKLLLVDEDLTGIPSSMPTINWQTLEPTIDQYSSTNPAVKISSNDLAYILYTSGTTGKPKGVMIKHSSLSSYVKTFGAYFQLTENDRMIQQSSIAFDTMIEEIYPILSSGGTLIVLRDGSRDIAQLIRAIDIEKATILSTSPAILEEINKKAGDVRTLRTIISGGDRLEAFQMNNLIANYHLYNTYGPTESTVCATFHQISDLSRPNIIGKPIRGREVYILDESLQIKPEGSIGEIFLGGNGLASGYLNLPGLTAEKFISNPYSPDERLFRTGDLGKWLSDGTLEFVGRADYQVKIKGVRIELEEVEHVLLTHSAIRQAVVIFKAASKSLSAFVVLSEPVDFDNIRRHLQNFLPTAAIPQHIVKLDNLPVTAHGKIDRALLSNNDYTVQENIYLAPRDAKEETLALMWRSILRKDRIGVQDNFFQLGGDSLSAVQMLARVRHSLSVSIPLKDFFLRPNIEALAFAVNQANPWHEDGPVPVEKQSYYEVSNPQRRLWILGQTEAAKLAYNETEAYILTGDLNLKTFELALHKIVERHESLRTTFHIVDGEICQRIHAPQSHKFRLEYFDISNESDVLSKVHVELDEAVGVEFNLSEGPLLRALLFKIDQGKHVFGSVAHHIITDGWSSQVLMRELVDNYVKAETGRPITATSLTVQYKDFAQWQNKLIRSDFISGQRSFWTDQFKDGVPELSIPTDFPRLAERTYNGQKLYFKFPENLQTDLIKLSQSQNASLFMTLMAAVTGLLYKYTGQREIVIGTPTAGRNHHLLENQVGFYVNLLPLLMRVDPARTFRQLLNQAKEVTLLGFENHAYPYDCLIDDLNQSNQSNHTTLFNVLVSLLNKKDFFQEHSQQSFLHFEKLNRNSSTSKFDISFYFEQSEKDLELIIEFNTDLFIKETINRIFVHLEKFLSGICQDDDIPVKNIEIITQSEKQQLIQYFNQTAASFPEEQTVQGLFEEQADKYPESIALVSGRRLFSYRKLDEKANQLANYLLSNTQIIQDEPIGLMLNRNEDVHIAILAIWKVGASYVPIESSFPKDRISYMIEDIGMKTMLIHSDFLTLCEDLQWELPTLQTLVCLDAPDRDDWMQAEEESTLLWDFIEESAENTIAASGWINSFTGRPFEPEDINEMVANVVEKVAPHLNQQMNVLEIGCGTGDILRQLAPQVGKYTGTDISSRIIDKCLLNVKRAGLRNVELRHMPAMEIGLFPEKTFDVIVMNSVMQYFPSHAYAREFLARATKVLKPGGILFIGDIRDKNKQTDYYQELFKDSPEIEKDIANKKSAEKELFVAPAFLQNYFNTYTSKSDITISQKIGTIRNELYLYRFDAMISVSSTVGYEARKSADGVRVLVASPQNFSSVRPDTRQPGNVAYTLYTSGSTGKPKGVTVNHTSVVNFLSSMTKVPGFKKEDSLLSVTTYIFDISVLEFFLPLVNGGTVVMTTREQSRDAFQLMDLIRQHRPSVMQATPSTWKMLLEVGWEGDPQLRVLCGGESIGKSLAEQLIAKAGAVWNMYGPTETTIWSTVNQLIKPEDALSIGKPIDNTCVYILDEEKNLVPIGVLGEIVIGGKGVAKGYYKRETLTAERFIVSPFSKKDRLYRTGDVGKWKADGTIYFLGRLDNQVKIRGHRIEMGEIEFHLLQHEQIKDALVIASNELDVEKKLVAYIIFEQTVSPFDLNSYLIKSLPEYMLPSFYIPMVSFPRTANGKINRNALPPYHQQLSNPDVKMPGNQMEQSIAAIWQEVLMLDKISIKDNFFASGGHSLRAVTVMSRMVKELGVEIELRDIFNNPTVEMLAQVVRDKAKRTYISIPLASKSSHYDLSRAQLRFWLLEQDIENKGAYNIPAALRIRGNFDSVALEAAIQQLVYRHEGLRTSFRKVQNEPKQFIHAADSFHIAVKYTDLRANVDGHRRVNQIVASDVREGFDLANEPLLRVHLIQTEEENYVALFILHHIIADRWSIDLIVKEIMDSYENHLVGKQPKAPDRVQYKDYSDWHNQLLKSEYMSRQEQYWVNIFRTLPEQIALPVKHVESDRKGFETTFYGKLTLEETLLIKQTCVNENTTIYLFILTAFKILLSKISGQEDIAVGTAVAARSHSDLETVIGVFVNTVLIRSQPLSEKTFRSYLADVMSVSFDAFNNQEFPFNELVTKVGGNRNHNRNPLFNVFFEFEEQDVPVALPGVIVESYPFRPSLRAKFDLNLRVQEVNNELMLAWAYPINLYNENIIPDMHECLVHIINQVCISAETKLSNINFPGEILTGDIDTENSLTTENNPLLNITFNLTDV